MEEKKAGRDEQDIRPPRYPYQRIRRPSIRQRKYVKNLFNPNYKTKSEAAQEAGFKNPPDNEGIQWELRRLMDQAGLSDNKLVKKLKQCIYGSKDEDNSVKALRMAFELKDLFPANRKSSELSLSQINIYKELDINVLTTRIRELLERIGEEESQRRPLLPDKGNSGLQRPDGDIPQGTLPESTNGK